MEPNELRIGSIIGLSGQTTGPHYYSVSKIGEGGIEQIRPIDPNYSQNLLTLNHRSYPIPVLITEERLVKFGGRKYEPVNNLWFIGDYTFLFENGQISLYDPDRCVHISNKYRYVHQFQNLVFALTQHELTISENIPA